MAKYPGQNQRPPVIANRKPALSWKLSDESHIGRWLLAKTVKPHEQVDELNFLQLRLRVKRREMYIFLSRLDGNAITAEVILDVLENNLLAELETRKAA